MKHLTAFFENLSIELISEDTDVSNCIWDYAAKHWTIAITDDTPIRQEFDYYGGDLATIENESDLLLVLQNLLDDALVIVEGKSNFYDDSIDYLISELGYEYKDAKKVAVGCRKVYNKLSKVIYYLDDKVYDYLDKLSEIEYQEYFG
jgi:hypothetical protein